MKKWITIGKFWKKYKYKIFLLQILEIISVIVVSWTPYLNTKIYDEGIMKGNGRVFVNAILLYSFLGLINIFIFYVLSILKTKYRYVYIKDLKKILLNRFLINKSTYTSADIDTILSMDVSNFISLFSDNILELLYSSIKVIVFSFIISFMNWKLSVISLFLVFLLLFANYKMGRIRTSLGDRNHDLFVRQTRNFNEIIRYIKEIRNIGAKNYAENSFETTINEINDALLESQKVEQKMIALSDFLRLLMECVLLGGGGILIVKGKLSIGVLIAFIGYSSRLYGETSSIIDTYAEYKINKKSVDIITNELQQAMMETKLINITKTEVHEIEFKNINYKFSDAKKFLFKNVNMKLNSNKINYLIGKSGIGKSTVVKLLMNEISDYQGMILFDGVDYKKRGYCLLDNLISWVPQEAVLFSDTIYNNLTLGNDINIDTVIKYCKVCQIYDEIMELPNKLDSVIGDDGVTLSGGQKQRISIVRALLQDKPILVFDEITSAISHESMLKIKSALKEIARNKLVLIITHDMEFVVENSNIYQIENRKIKKVTFD